MEDNDKQQHSLNGIASLAIGLINIAVVFRLFREFFKAGPGNLLLAVLFTIAGFILGIVGLKKDKRRWLAVLGLIVSSLQVCAIGGWLAMLMIW